MRYDRAVGIRMEGLSDGKHVLQYRGTDRVQKYMKEYSDLNLTSVKPVKIHGAKEMYVYDTKKRKLHYYVEDLHAGGLSVKNSTIIGFSVADSACKTLRKPDKQIKDIMNSSKPNARKYFKAIKTVDTKLSGRFNANLVILRVH